MANEDIKKAIKDAGLTHWRVATLLDISENTLSRRLREELNPNDKNEILKVVEENKMDLKIKVKN